jgi:hypothetical protein
VTRPAVVTSSDPTPRRALAPLAAVLAQRRGLVLIILLFGALVATHLDAVPIWDAKNYLYCVEVAVQRPFDLLNFRCWDHPSIVYTLLWSLSQYVWPWHASLVIATNAVLGAASIAAFDALVRLLFPGRSRVEYTLVTALFALAPLWVAHAIFLNVDYGATAFFVLFLYFLLAHRFWLANIFALALIFSKETGGAAYAVTLVAYVVAFMFGSRRSRAQRMAWLGSHAPLVATPLAVMTYILLVNVFRPRPLGWLQTYAPVQVISDRLEAILNTNLADPGIRSFLADIFVLNCQWLYTGVVLLALGAALLQADRHDDEPIGLPRQGIFLAVVLAGLVYVLTRFRPTNAARYVMLAAPMLILAFYHALLAICASRLKRVCYLTLCAALVFVSNFRTIDVVSRSIFGTIPFGSHVMLDMPSLTGGLRLDAMVYNLEYLQLEYLYGDLMRDLRPRPGSTLLMGNALYNFPPDVEGPRYALTADPSRAIPFFVAIGDVARSVLQTHLQREGELFFYMAFPNADNEQLRNLLNEYGLVAKKQYKRYGYTLDLYTFRFALAR